MENASKALLIAGAIMISIFLISSGVLLMNYTSGATDTTQKTSETLKVQSSNAEITPYLGQYVSASQTKAFLNTVIAKNQNNPEAKILINFYYSGQKKTHQSSTSDLQTILKLINDKKHYKILVTTGCGTYKNNKGYKNNGYYGCIYITQLST